MFWELKTLTKKAGVIESKTVVVDLPSLEEIKAMRKYFQQEKTEKNTPISTVCLCILKDLEKGTVSLPEREELAAMRTLLKQDPSIKVDDVCFSILNDFELKLKETPTATISAEEF